MARFEDLTRGARVKGILPDRAVIVVDVERHGSPVDQTGVSMVAKYDFAVNAAMKPTKVREDPLPLETNR